MSHKTLPPSHNGRNSHQGVFQRHRDVFDGAKDKNIFAVLRGVSLQWCHNEKRPIFNGKIGRCRCSRAIEMSKKCPKMFLRTELCLAHAEKYGQTRQVNISAGPTLYGLITSSKSSQVLTTQQLESPKIETYARDLYLSCECKMDKSAQCVDVCI